MEGYEGDLCSTDEQTNDDDETDDDRLNKKKIMLKL